ncbi:MAG: hypothetical protein ACT4UP_11375 [Gammaproteobacteria bacterium]
MALVSFYVWDCGNEKASSYRIYGGNYTYRVTNTRNRNVAKGEVAVGMQLLTPAEFLDTSARLEAYGAFKMEMGGINKFLRGLQEKGAGGVWQWGAPDDYRVIELFTVGNVKSNQFQLGMQGVGVAKAAVSLGHDLAQALGVDAVVILYNVVQADKTAINMRGAGLYMFGPNPLPDCGDSLCWSGHQYSGAYLRMKDIPFIKTDKFGNLVEADYAGYAIVAGALGTRMAQHIKKKTG